MDETLKIFILDNVKSIRSRVKLLLDTNKVAVYEASNCTEFLQIWEQNGHNANLIIMDIDLKDEDGFELIRKVREKNKEIPIMILTANNYKSTFISGIEEGISDYMLKPFEDLILSNKILKLISVSENLIENKVILNLPFFIQSEFKKATKGKYNVSIMMTTFYKPEKVLLNENNNEYNNVSQYLYDNLKDIFWDTDIFIRYASQNFIGVFPFASSENKDLISGKVDACFNDLKLKDPKLKEYCLSNVFVTYPQDIKEDEDVFGALLEKTKKAIKAKEVGIDKRVIKETSEDLEEYNLSPRKYE
jgi:two-component system response regulator PhoP